MSAYFSNLSNQRDVIPTQYLLNSKLTSYQSPHLPDNIMYLNAPSATVTHPELFSGTSLPAHDYAQTQSVDSREEMLFIAPSGNPVIMQPIDRQLSIAPKFSDNNGVVMEDQVFTKNLLCVHNSDQNFHHQGLSLSLGNQVPPSVQVPSYPSPYTNSGVSSLLSSQGKHTIDHRSQSSELKKDEYFLFDLAGQTSDNFKSGSIYNPQPSKNSEAMNSDPKLQEEKVFEGMIYNSKCLKAVQELLDEVVNLYQDLKHPEKHHESQLFGHDVSEGAKLKSNCQSVTSLDTQKPMAIPSDELSLAERNELQDKMTKLFSMLDEVDRRYKQYYHQLQVVISSFEIVAGSGASRRYTALALRTISRQFCCLRDAIKKQIQVVQQSLGGQGTVTNNQGVVLSRLRYVDQQVRQQRTLQQFGMMRQPWRPQRGLPENAVSVLRAWLFEHFLHPYPNDSEKILLARQTGLTRSQVANWFINARVRLWKPMIEEMYKNEFGEMEADSKSSPELAQAAGRLRSESEDTGEELHDNLTSAGADVGQLGQSNEYRTTINSDVEVNAYTENLSIQEGFHEEDKMGSELHKSWSDKIDQSNQNNDQNVTSATSAYNFSMLGGRIGTQVSLA